MESLQQPWLGTRGLSNFCHVQGDSRVGKVPSTGGTGHCEGSPAAKDCGFMVMSCLKEQACRVGVNGSRH